MTGIVPSLELKDRLNRFRFQMDADHPGWDVAIFFGRINLYYFTGTMQDGMLVVPRKSDAIFWVRRSYERALAESRFPDIRQMSSFRDAAGTLLPCPVTVYLETEIVPLALFLRLQRAFPFSSAQSLDRQVARCRATKSAYELALMEQAGSIHQRVLEELVPEILSEGMSEAELCAELFRVMIREGHDGVTRFGMFGTEVVLGQIGFGESSIYPSYFNGPGSCYGMCPAVPLVGSRTRTLRNGDLVFLDTGCSCSGYNTDKTMTYMFGRALPDDAIASHDKCVKIQDSIAALLQPGAIPSEIYSATMAALDPAFRQDFMGFSNRQVNFLGHSIGLQIDETPVLAQGFDEPLEAGMVFAVEPKRGIRNVGMVGIENTFVVTPHGGRSITGHHHGLLPVY
ncbi:MAG: Xaa-Pro peptidase family protein [Methanoregula sp.]